MQSYRFFPVEIDLFELLRDDHAQQRECLQHLISAPLDAARRLSGTLELITLLRVHAAAEQRTLYAGLLGQHAGQLPALCCIDEHRHIEQLLPRLLGMAERANDAQWRRAVIELQRELERHQEEEEHAIFCLLGQQLTARERMQLAQNYRREVGLQQLLLQLELPP